MEKKFDIIRDRATAMEMDILGFEQMVSNQNEEKE
jgi:hypothetical protein